MNLHEIKETVINNYYSKCYSTLIVKRTAIIAISDHIPPDMAIIVLRPVWPSCTDEIVKKPLHKREKRLFFN